MLRAIAPIIGSFGMLAVVACSGRDPVANGANNTAELPAVNEPAPSATGEVHGDAVRPAGPLPTAAVKIPVTFQGRWGLTPDDCVPGRSDAKGLLEIAGDELHFYESRAVPAKGVSTDANSISGDFAFTGEGMQWTKFQSLQLRGHELVRTETNPAASFTYAKCT